MMKKLLFIFLFSAVSFSGYSQYGRLEPVASGDTSLMVLRTPVETIKRLTSSTNKKERKVGTSIESLERQLDLLRGEYNLGRSNTSNMPFIVNAIKSLDAWGVEVSNYVQEALFYSKQRKRGAY
jgi:hypothetical protein